MQPLRRRAFKYGIKLNYDSYLHRCQCPPPLPASPQWRVWMPLPPPRLITQGERLLTPLQFAARRRCAAIRFLTELLISRHLCFSSAVVLTQPMAATSSPICVHMVFLRRKSTFRDSAPYKRAWCLLTP